MRKQFFHSSIRIYLRSFATPLLVLLVAGCQAPANEPTENAPPAWEAQNSGTTVSLRGLSVVSDSVVWASGSNGTYLRTDNGGETWEAGIVPEASELDFRDVEAVDAETALVLSAGEPAKIYKTTDGGKSWTEHYSNETPGVFFDSMAFWDRETGIAFSDPIEGSFLIIKTTDGGVTWTPVLSENLPTPEAGEAGFAASGTSVAVQGTAQAWIGTGGARARVLRTTDQGENWTISETPMQSGEPSTGIFSVAFLDESQGVVAGGDYQNPDVRGENASLTTDGGLTWTLADTPPLGYRSGVAFVPHAETVTLVAVGTTGSDFSVDGGTTWSRLGSEGFHVVGFSPSGKVGWAAGADGRVARITSSRFR